MCCIISGIIPLLIYWNFLPGAEGQHNTLQGVPAKKPFQEKCSQIRKSAPLFLSAIPSLSPVSSLARSLKLPGKRSNHDPGYVSSVTRRKDEGIGKCFIRI